MVRVRKPKNEKSAIKYIEQITIKNYEIRRPKNLWPITWAISYGVKKIWGDKKFKGFPIRDF